MIEICKVVDGEAVKTGFADQVTTAVLVTTGIPVGADHLDPSVKSKIEELGSFVYHFASDGRYFYHHSLNDLQEEIRDYEESLLVGK